MAKKDVDDRAKEDEKRKSSKLIDGSIGSITPELVGRYGEAVGERIRGYTGEVDPTGKVTVKGLKQIAESKVDPKFEYQNIKQQAGFAAEVDYRTNVNAENIINKSSERIARSNDVGMGNHPAADFVSVDQHGNPILINGNPEWSAQMKFCGKYNSPAEIQKSAKNVVDKFAGSKFDKYRGQKLLIPSEQYDISLQYARDKASEFRTAAQRFRSSGDLDKAAQLDARAAKFETVADNLVDSKISSREAMFIRKNPKLHTARKIAQTSHQAGLEMAKASVITSAVISMSTNTVALVNGNKELSEAVVDIAIDVGRGAAVGYAHGAATSVVSGVMERSSNMTVQSLSKTSLPGMIVAVSYQVGKSVVRWVNGEIDGVQFVLEVGEAGVGVLAGSIGASIGTAVFPGIGTVVGGMVGYLVGSMIYNSTVNMVLEYNLSEERLKAVTAISQAALLAMEASQRDFETAMEMHFKRRAQVLKSCFKTMDEAVLNNDHESFTRGLSAIAVEMGSCLQFKDFSEFDGFMKSDNKLVL